jgi:hypothetical protein
MGLHLSEQNNSPAHVRSTLGSAFADSKCPLHLATQDSASEWLALD